jgi:hypothetical protein
MFVRKVSVRLKSNTGKQFMDIMESEVLPWLRTQKGFLHLITLAVTGGNEAQALSFWDHGEDAQAYNSSGYPAVLKILETLLEGVPDLKTYDVVSSTLKEFRSLRETGSDIRDVNTENRDNGSYEATL